MDNYSITNVVSKFKELKLVFRGVWSSDNFPIFRPSFQVINTSRANTLGTHWILLIAIPSRLALSNKSYRGSRKTGKKTQPKRKKMQMLNIIIWNSLNIPLCFFDYLHSRIQSLYSNTHVFILHKMTSEPSVQSLSSNLCGLYCIYVATLFFRNFGQCPMKKSETHKDIESFITGFRAKCVNILKQVRQVNEISLVQFFNCRSISNYKLRVE